MKFDMIIGNPPYGCTEDHKGAMYDRFIMKAIDNADNVVMIVPSFKDKKIRARKLIDNGIQEYHHYPECAKIFGDKNTGAIAYFNYKKDYKGKTIVKYHYPDLYNSIIDKITTSPDYEPLTKNAEWDYWGIGHNKSEWLKKTYRFKKISNKVSEDQYIHFKSATNFEGYTWLRLNEILRHTEKIRDYQIAYPIMWRVGSYQVKLLPDEVCSRWMYVIESFKTEDEMMNCFNYLNTNFVKCIETHSKLSASKFNKADLLNIPYQDFTKQHTDKDLYTKYKLTDDEINYIERLTMLNK